MRHHLKLAPLALAAALSASALGGAAQAMPMNGLASASSQVSVHVDTVRWVCGPYRCWWRPGPYWGGPYWRPHYGYWGWHRWGWRGWSWHHRWS
jgi:hypothetical protein